MKNFKKFGAMLLVMITMCIMSVSAQDFKIEPMVKIGFTPNISESIHLVNAGSFHRYYYREDGSEAGCMMSLLKQNFKHKFQYYTTLGLRLSYHGFTWESVNKINITSSEWMGNKPYSVDFYARFYYEHKKIRIGYEHLCIHPIETGDVGMSFTKRGGHDEFFISYNMH